MEFHPNRFGSFCSYRNSWVAGLVSTGTCNDTAQLPTDKILLVSLPKKRYTYKLALIHNNNNSSLYMQAVTDSKATDRSAEFRETSQR